MPELIFEDRERCLVLQRSNTYTPQFVEFLQGIVWGSGGGQYTMPKVADSLNRLQDPHFFSLTQNGQLVAVTSINYKTTTLQGQTYPACYSYGIAVHPAQRGLGLGTLMAEHRLRYGLDLMGPKGLFYGYIEADNINSLKTITKVGSKSFGQYQALFLSRLFPRHQARVQKLDEPMKEQMVTLLSRQYGSHALTDLDQSVRGDEYYILREKEEIVAGVQCHKQQLTIKHMPGASGLFLARVLPHLPAVRRLFPERNLHFLTFGNIYGKPGREGTVFSLLEALLARHRLHFAMIYMDSRSPVYQRLAAARKFGLFHPFINIPVQVMGYFKGFSAGEIAAIRRQPLFVSMNDPV